MENFTGQARKERKRNASSSIGQKQKSIRFSLVLCSHGRMRFVTIGSMKDKTIIRFPSRSYLQLQ